MSRRWWGGVLLLLIALPALASGVSLDSVRIDLADQAALREGAKLFGDYCAGCHSLKYQRYQQVADDLGLPAAELLKHGPAGSRASEPMLASMAAVDAQKVFGAVPPDLTLAARVHGNDWLYSYLHGFYEDKSRPWGANNLIEPNVGMPNVLAALQGRRVLECADKAAACVLSAPIPGSGSLSPAQFDAKVKNLVAFLAYSSTPVKLKSQRIGTYVLLYLAFFLVFAWLLKREYWKDVHSKL